MNFGVDLSHQHMFDEGFLPKNPGELLFTSDDPKKIMTYLKKNL